MNLLNLAAVIFRECAHITGMDSRCLHQRARPHYLLQLRVLGFGLLQDAGTVSRLSSRRSSAGLLHALRFDVSRARLRRQHVGQFVGFPKPLSNRCLDFIAVLDVNDVIYLEL